MYFSVSLRQWLKALVIGRRAEDGSVMLDTRGGWLTQDQQDQRLRPRAALDSTHGDVLDELVATFSASSFFGCYAMEARAKAAPVLDGCCSVAEFSQRWSRLLENSHHKFEAQEGRDVARDLRQHGSSVGESVQAIITLAMTPPETVQQALTPQVGGLDAPFAGDREELPLEAFSTADPSLAGGAVGESSLPETVEPPSNVCGAVDVPHLPVTVTPSVTSDVGTVTSPTEPNLRDQQSAHGPLQDVREGGSITVPPVAHAVAYCILAARDIRRFTKAPGRTSDGSWPRDKIQGRLEESAGHHHAGRGQTSDLGEAGGPGGGTQGGWEARGRRLRLLCGTRRWPAPGISPQSRRGANHIR